MKQFLIGGAVAALAMASAAVAAQTAPPAGVAPGVAPAPMTPPTPGTPHVRVMFNSDHDMTRAEVADHVGKMFAKLDTNHDGNISRQEFTAGKPQVRTEQVFVMRDGAPGAPGAHPPMEGMDGMRMHMRHIGGMGMGGRFGGHLLEMADGNHDGRVSLAEAQAAALAHFDKADLNHDGKITPDERKQNRVIRLERRQG